MLTTLMEVNTHMHIVVAYCPDNGTLMTFGHSYQSPLIIKYSNSYLDLNEVFGLSSIT